MMGDEERGKDANWHLGTDRYGYKVFLDTLVLQGSILSMPIG